MFQKFLQNLSKQPGWKQKKYLLAVSGGIDSTVLADLFKQAQLDFALAHCNFKLRDADSDADQAFVNELARQLGVPLFQHVCDLSHTTENIQLAARNRRYNWFKKILIEENYDYLVTGHHLDDSLESFLLNLQRGTGLKGLLGIQNRGYILRPLQKFSRPKIKAYALQHHLKWREDKSNDSEKYRRNYIRHQIVPLLTQKNPAFYANFTKTLEYLQQSQNIIDNWVKDNRQKLIKQEEETYKLDLNAWQNLIEKELFLYHWLTDYGFTDLTAAIKLTQAQTGKSIFSPTHQLTKHGDWLILHQKLDINRNKIYNLDFKPYQEIEDLQINMHLFEIDEITVSQLKNAQKNEIFVDFDLLTFPLYLRKWQTGDYFYPLGMKGKKKLSDYFKDEKLSLPEKEKIWLLLQHNNIIWVAGKRPDERFKITDKTKKILHISIQQKND